MVKNLLLSECNTALKSKLLSLTLPGSSLMRDTIAIAEETKKFDPELFVYYSKTKCLGWALLSYDEWFHRNFSNGNPIVMIYVDFNYRRQKIGTLLLNEIKIKYPKVRSMPWDRVSKAFYAKHNTYTFAGVHPSTLAYF